MIHIFHCIPRRNFLPFEVLPSGYKANISNILRALIKARTTCKVSKYGREKSNLIFSQNILNIVLERKRLQSYFSF